MKLYQLLRSKEGDLRLADRLLHDVRVEAEKRLDLVRVTFPLYTDHTVRHSDSVLDYLDEIMPDAIKTQLNEWEIYFLIAAVYLHDLGMIETCPAPPSGDEWDDFLAKRLAAARIKPNFEPTLITERAKRDFIRDHHHERSQDYIIANARDLGLRATDTRAEGEIVGRLALGHRKVDLGDRLQFGEIPFRSEMIRRDLMAAYLRLADELDTTAHRTPLAEYEALDIYDETSRDEWEKHLSISGVSIDNGVIVLGGRCYSHRIFLRLRKLGLDLNAKLSELKRMLPRPYATGTGFLVQDPLPFHDVELRVEPQGFLPIEISFQLQDEQIMQLIMGERLYGDKTACIRELLQNAVDTCREAIEHRPGSYSPQITVTEEDGGAVLRVDDNGMGMDEYIVRQYFCRVGFSYYRSSDFAGNFRPTSEFGIGVLSCFMLADRLEIETLRAGGEPLALTITSLTEPFIPRRGTRKVPGTSIKLCLRPEHVGAYDYSRLVVHYARYVTIPIVVMTKEGVTHRHQRGLFQPDLGEFLPRLIARDALHLDGENPDDEKALSALETVVSDAMTRGSYQLTDAGFELGVMLSAGPHGVAWEADRYWTFEQQRASRVTNTNPRANAHSALRLYQDGFFVCEIRPESWRISYQAWTEVNITGATRLRLTADRTRFLEGEEEVKDAVRELQSRALEHLYQRITPSQSPYDWWAYHIAHYTPIGGRSVASSSLPIALQESALANAVFCTCSHEGFSSRDYRAILEWQGKVASLLPHDHELIQHFLPFLPEDLLVVFVPWWLLSTPTQSQGTDGLLGYSLLKGRIDLTQARIPATLQAATIGRQRNVVFFDLGKPSGLFALPDVWRALLYYGPMGDPIPSKLFIDRRHPLGEVLDRHCRRPLTPACEALLALMGPVHGYRELDVTFQRDLFQVLQRDGIVPSDLSLPDFEGLQIAEHTCPYAGEPPLI
jgi:hypothetical protein